MTAAVTLNFPLPTSLVLVGMMGAGKSTVGRRLAKRLEVPFVDTDEQIETDVGVSISDIFSYEGEDKFRAYERRTMKRLLEGEPRVIGTGGGLYVQEGLRKHINKNAISIWLDAPLDVLEERVSRRNNRPLLKQGNKREILARLLEERRPFYEQALMHIESGHGSHASVVTCIIETLNRYFEEYA